MNNINYKKLLDEQTSFSLIRTNPLLTGNVKLTISSDNNIFLNSIDANEELATEDYKNIPVDENYSHPLNIKKFFRSGKTPSNIIFDLKRDVNPNRTSTKYEDQYDFSLYYSGVNYLVNKGRDEKFSYFAPLYLRDVLPDYFVIFRIKDPMNYPIDQSKVNYPFDQKEYIYDLFKNGSIIKTFDLTEKQKIGRYLKKYTSDKLFPKSPLKTNFEEDLMSTWNGISVSSGTFTEKGEFLNSFLTTEYPVKKLEEYITLGYQRNNIIFPNILNLEFLFDETDEVEDYDMNRYIGLYINKVDLGKLTLDLDAQYRLNGESGNLPFFLKKKWTEIDDVVDNIENTEGVNLFYKDNTNELFNGSLDKDNLYFNYIEDKNNNLYLPNTTDAIDENAKRITLSNTKINLGNFFGTGTDFIKDSGSVPTLKGFSNAYFKITGEFNHLDKIIMYSALGSKIDSDGNKYDEFVALDHNINNSITPTFIGINSPGDYFTHFSSSGDTYYFSAKTTQNNYSIIADSLYGLLSAVDHRNYDVFKQGDTIILKLKTAGNFDNDIQFKYVPYNPNYNAIEINGKTGSQLINTIVPLDGGNILSQNRLVLDSRYRDKIISNLNDICIKTKNGFSYIEKVSYYIDIINDVSTDTEELRIESFAKYFNNIVLTLVDREQPSIKTNQFVIKNRFDSHFGLLSIFPIKDFNYDFYSSDYSNFPFWELYKYFYVPEKKDLIEKDKTYRVLGTGSILYNDVQYNSGDNFVGVVDKTSYLIDSGTPLIIYDFNLTEDEDKELESFNGFSTLKDPVIAVAQRNDDVWKFKDKFSNGLVNTEYDYYKENFTKDFALTSKLLPYITKWAYKGGKDVRNNPYRLNSNVHFGINNFSPNHNDTSQNPENFTHEWPYLEAAYEFLKDKETLRKAYSYFNESFDLDRCLNEEDYFVNYFSFKNELDGDELDNLQTRYSFINFNKDRDFCETFFKGVKLIFKEVSNKTILGEDKKPIFNVSSKKYDGYKFSVLLKPVKEEINNNEQAPIKFRFVEHEDYKYILLLIEVSLGYFDDLDNDLISDTKDGDYRIKFDVNNLSDLTYTLLYSLKHKKNNLPDLSNGYSVYTPYTPPTDLFPNQFAPQGPVSSHSYSNIKLSFYVGLDSNNTDVINNSLLNNLVRYNKITNPNISNYDSDPQDEIHALLTTFQVDSNPSPNLFTTLGPYGTLVFRRNDTGQEFDILRYDFFSQTISRNNAQKPIRITPTGGFDDTYYSISPIIGVSPQGIIMQKIQDIVSGRDESVMIEQTQTILPSPLNLYTIQDDIIFKQKSGGLSYHESLFKKLSFAKIKDYVNSLNPIIEYHTFNSSTINDNRDSFYLEILNPSMIKKEVLLGYKADIDKPNAVKTTDLIGFEYYQFPVKNEIELDRYNGGYEPIFKDILKFKDNKDFSWKDGNKIDLANLVLNTTQPNFGLIKNFNHLKIVEKNIMLLGQNEDTNLLYPLIDEIAIGQKDFQIFTANWEWGFHQKYNSKTSYEPVAGSFRVIEDNSFMNKVLNVPFSVKLDNFQLFDVGPTSELRDADIDKYEIIIKETTTNIEGIINIKNVLLRYFMENGADRKFREFLLDESQYLNKLNLDQYIRLYLESNILKLYTIDKTDFFVQRTKDSDEIVFNFIDDETRVAEGYILLKDVTVQKVDNLTITFSLRKESNNGFKISPSVKIKLI